MGLSHTMFFEQLQTNSVPSGGFGGIFKNRETYFARTLLELCRAYFSREDALLLLLFAHMLQILKKRKRQICAVMKNHRRRKCNRECEC
jgi:hypothetical protein